MEPNGHGAAWEARRLMRSVRQAALATVSDGLPFVSLVTPAVAADGSILMLLSALSEHTRHLRGEPRCALLFTGAATTANPQTAPRLTVRGAAEVADDRSLKDYWLGRHPYAAFYADLPDFTLWKVMPETGFHVGGFAQAMHLSGEALRPAPADAAALALAAPAILAHCNGDHAAALADLAAAHGRSGAWTMLGVDCDGFDLVQGEAVVRIGFPQPVCDADGVRSALLALLSESRERASMLRKG